MSREAKSINFNLDARVIDIMKIVYCDVVEAFYEDLGEEDATAMGAAALSGMEIVWEAVRRYHPDRTPEWNLE